MGMYTEFYFRADLKRDTPEEVIGFLTDLFGPSSDDPEELPDHPFFECARWSSLFFGASAYFPDAMRSAFSRGWGDFYQIAIHSSLKNYGGEIDQFLDWIGPYLSEQTGSFLGYSLYEESDTPTLYHAR
jgi:hypothetical protein